MANLYLSGVRASSVTYDTRVHGYTRFRLLSTHGAYLKSGRRWVQEIANHRDTREIGLMFDSGAFTVWTKDEPDIEVRELLRVYASAFKNLKDKFKEIWFINLDKIPGKISRAPTQDEISHAIRVSDDNFRVLSAELGSHVLPVFHRSESPERLQETIGLNPEYICLSPKTDGAEKYRREWSQRVLQLCNGVRTHGLAATGSSMLSQVPWHSVDSSSWIQTAAFGGIMIPNKLGFAMLPVSEHSSSRRDFGQHIDTIGRDTLRLVTDLCEKLKLTIAELREQSGARLLFNVYVSNLIADKGFTETPIQTTLLEL